ncbi:MAG: Flp pilus assembly complex ATPase component TadA [Thaumarchaeota archaeon]|nr:Flp pilus assembly complex ATPase component TadA [Nitrososphaerota archaeon]
MGGEKSEHVNTFPTDLQEVLARRPYLNQYLSKLGEDNISTPAWFLTLDKRLNKEEVNLIYPVSEEVFIHIFRQKSMERARYIIIEPTRGQDLTQIMNTLENIFAYKLDEEHIYRNIEEKKAALSKLIDSTLKVDNSLKDLTYRITKGKNPTFLVNEKTKELLEYLLVRDKIGVGPLEPMIKDPYIEDISFNGLGPVFVEHKVFGSCVSSLRFDDQEQLDEYVKRLAERIGRPISYRNPIVDGTLPDGSRINIVYGSEISRHGTNFTIRKFSKIPISITQLCLWNTISYLPAAYLWMLLEFGISVWVCGETASGKTTTLNALCAFINPTAKIVSVEDTPEVTVPHENWIREVTKEGEGDEGKIDLFTLLKAALRQRPNYIIVGEIRGREGNVAFQAMQTGHPVIATFHAATVQKLIQRLTGSPIEVPKTYIDNIGAVVIQSAVKVPKTGKIERRVLSINEILGYDSVEDRFNYIEIFTWDPLTDVFLFRGEGTSYLLENKLAVFYGYSKREVREIYNHLRMRAELLRLLAEAGVTDYFDLWFTLKTIKALGIERALELMRKGKLLEVVKAR